MGQSIAIGQRWKGHTAFAVLGAISLCHLFNDTMQTLLPAIYPLLRSELSLSFVQLGLITLVFRATGSFLQPLIGRFTNRRPQLCSLPVGVNFTMAGIPVPASTDRYYFNHSPVVHTGTNRLDRAA